MRRTMRRSCAVLLALLGPLVVPVQASSARSARSIALGFDVPHSGSAHTQLDTLEAQLGRKVAVTRDFLVWNSTFPTSYENWLGARGTVPIISVRSRTSGGAAVPFASVAGAPVGSALYTQMVSWADRIKAFGYPVYFDYNHEPEASGSSDLGTSTDFVAAWRRLHSIFVAQHVTNARFMWIMTSWSFRVSAGDARAAAKWYPGDAYVDAAAADGYNWSTCRTSPVAWSDLSTIVSGFVAFGAQHPALRLWLAEFASIEDPAVSGRKAAWIDDVRSLLRQPAYAQVAGISWFDAVQAGYAKCNWPVTTSSSALAATRALANDPFFEGSAAFAT